MFNMLFGNVLIDDKQKLDIIEETYEICKEKYGYEFNFVNFYNGFVVGNCFRLRDNWFYNKIVNQSTEQDPIINKLPIESIASIVRSYIESNNKNDSEKLNIVQQVYEKCKEKDEFNEEEFIDTFKNYGIDYEKLKTELQKQTEIQPRSFVKKLSQKTENSKQGIEEYFEYVQDKDNENKLILKLTEKGENIVREKLKGKEEDFNKFSKFIEQNFTIDTEDKEYNGKNIEEIKIEELQNISKDKLFTKHTGSRVDAMVVKTVCDCLPCFKQIGTSVEV